MVLNLIDVGIIARKLNNGALDFSNDLMWKLALVQVMAHNDLYKTRSVTMKVRRREVEHYIARPRPFILPFWVPYISIIELAFSGQHVKFLSSNLLTADYKLTWSVNQIMHILTYLSRFLTSLHSKCNRNAGGNRAVVGGRHTPDSWSPLQAGDWRANFRDVQTHLSIVTFLKLETK